jgi:hypothetical protein
VSQTDPEALPSDPAVAAAIAAVRPRPRRRWWILALVAVVLVGAAITGAVIVSGRNEDAPVEAVRAYVDAIARGDAAAANALVDPKSFGPGVDPALLTDEVLRSATRRITVGEVDLDFSADLDADVVEVEVDYTLGDVRSVVMLRAKRAGTTAGLLHEWRVIDPLLVPVRVQTNESRLETAAFGAGTVPVSGPEFEDFPQHRFFVYPGVYPLRGHDSRYLEAPRQNVVAANRDYGQRPADSEDYVVNGTVYYGATAELRSILTGRLAKYATACVAAMPKPPADCPETIVRTSSLVTSARLDRQPVIRSVQSYQVDYRGERTEPPLRMIADGQFSYTDIDGATGDELFFAYARIVVTATDELTITFTTEL